MASLIIPLTILLSATKFTIFYLFWLHFRLFGKIYGYKIWLLKYFTEVAGHTDLRKKNKKKLAVRILPFKQQYWSYKKCIFFLKVKGQFPKQFEHQNCSSYPSKIFQFGTMFVFRGYFNFLESHSCNSSAKIIFFVAYLEKSALKSG